jgi:predicted hydrocarbon binding protein
MLGARMERADGTPRATMEHAPSAAATPDGAACAFYGAAFAELLRQLTDFDGAMLHVRCRARGDDACVWGAGGNGTT